MSDHRTTWASSTARHQNATFKFKLKLVSSVVLCLLVTSSEPSSQNCSFDAETKRLWCSLRTLNTQNETASIQSASRAEQISVQCSDVFFYESILRTNHFGYLPNLRRLDLEFCKIRKIPALAFSGLSGLRDLSIQTHNSEWSAMVLELEQDSFTGLNNLRTLNFTHNNLWTLPRDTFCGLNSLTALNLSTNYLQEAGDLGFGSSNVRACRLPLDTLDVSHNSLTKINKGGFGQLQKLKKLMLESNSINVLEDGAFEGLDALQTLSLANNQLVALPPALFKSSRSKLQKLYLQNNSLSVLAPDIFQGLDQLLVLNISHNEVSNEWLTSTTFSSLVRLVALDVSFNKLTRLDQSLFAGMTSLQVLYLKQNQIHTVAPNTFINQNNLHILLLSHNAMENLHPRALAGLSVLKALSLDHNKLSGMHRNALRNCSSLQDLALNNNLFTSVPKAIKPLSLLRTLEVGENHIKTLHNDSFRGLQNLYGLRLAGNGLESIETGAFSHVETLQVLNLAHNRISELNQQVFHPLIELQILRLDNNQLRDINGLLTAQSELRWLNISSNHLQWFDYANIPKDLKWLDLHDNEIEDLANYYRLADGFNLKTLDASNNKIKKLNPLSIPKSLEYILLNGNQIHQIEANSFKDKQDLSRVELKSNNLEKLDLSSLAITAKPKGK